MKTLSFQLVIFIFLCFPFKLFSQDVVSFSAPDTVCTGEVLDIEYTGTVGEDFCWISSPLFNEPPFVRDVVGFPFGNEALFSKVIKLDEEYHIFISLSNPNNGNKGSLMRLDFGNNLNNIPIPNLVIDGEFPWGQEGIEIVKENNRWWGFITGYEYLVRLDFGNSITNVPIIENLGNFGSLSFPHDIFITKENNEWVGIVNDKSNNSIYRLLFGNSLENLPMIEPILNSLIGAPVGLFPLQVEENWYVFIVDDNSSSIFRLDFGNSLFNSPNIDNLGNLGVLDEPRDISIYFLCNQFCGVVIDRIDSKIYKLDFNNNIENIPVPYLIGDTDNFEFPHSISNGYLSDEGLQFFITNIISNNLTSLIFPFSPSDFFDCKKSDVPPTISFDSAGVHPLFLIVDEGTPQQSSFCKQIVAIPSPNLDLGNDTILCDGNILLLETNNDETIWQDLEVSSSFEVALSGVYFAEINDEKCSRVDSVNILFENCEECFIAPNVFTPNGDKVNDIFSPINKCQLELLDYDLQIFNRWGERVFHSQNPSLGWDGNNNNQTQLSDVYVWKLFYAYKLENSIIEKSVHGDVSLIH